jgi:hypothetical protein
MKRRRRKVAHIGNPLSLETTMINTIRSAITRSRERAAAKRAYRSLEGQNDHLLRDMGLTRETLYSAVVRGSAER